MLQTRAIQLVSPFLLHVANATHHICSKSVEQRRRVCLNTTFFSRVIHTRISVHCHWDEFIIDKKRLELLVGTLILFKVLNLAMHVVGSHIRHIWSSLTETLNLNYAHCMVFWKRKRDKRGHECGGGLACVCVRMWLENRSLPAICILCSPPLDVGGWLEVAHIHCSSSSSSRRRRRGDGRQQPALGLGALTLAPLTWGRMGPPTPTNPT